MNEPADQLPKGDFGRSSATGTAAAALGARQRWALVFSVGSLGFSALLTQLTLMRELLGAFSGNELVFGIVLGNWLLLTGIGAWLGRAAARLRRPLDALVVAQVLVALAPIVDVLLLRGLRNVVFVRGSEVGLTETLLSCLLLLAPYCAVMGFLLTLTSMLLAQRRNAMRTDQETTVAIQRSRHTPCAVADGTRSVPATVPATPLDSAILRAAQGVPAKEAAGIGQVYFLDNVGEIVGGLLFSFLLVYVANHLQILGLAALVNLVAACALAAVFGRRLLLVAVGVAAAAWGALALGWDLDALSAAWQFPGQEIVYRGNSPYGSLVVTRSSGQHNFLENGVPLFSTHNVEEVEETVHYAMAQRPEARRVLLVSGGVSGTAKEILKYPRATVDYVELDPLILQIGHRFLPENLADPRIEVINTDGRQFLRRSDCRYDVVLVAVPDPSTFQINRFYTREFFAEVKRRLAADGVLAISLGHYENRLSAELARLIAVAHRTLNAEFRNVLVLPAMRNWFLASDGPLSAEIASALERHRIPTLLLKRHYLRATLSPDRIADVRRAAAEEAPVNQDFNPVLYYYHLRFWMSRFQVRFGVLGAILLVGLLAALVRVRPVSLAVLTSGLAASALAVVLLVAFQILYGCVYHQVGLIVTAFMMGLGIGSFTMNRTLDRRGRKDFARLVFAVAIYAAWLPLILVGLGELAGRPGASLVAHGVVLALAGLLGLLLGLQFPLAAKIDFENVTATAGRLYWADFLGAALGALLVSTVLIPLVGVSGACLLMAGLNAVSGAVLLATSSG